MARARGNSKYEKTERNVTIEDLQENKAEGIERNHVMQMLISHAKLYLKTNTQKKTLTYQKWHKLSVQLPRLLFMCSLWHSNEMPWTKLPFG